MTARKALIILIVICFFVPQFVLAQKQIPIEIDHNGKDAIGTRLSYQIKEGIRRSAGLRLALGDEPRIVVHMITMDIDLPRPGCASAAAYTYTFMVPGKIEVYLNAGMSICGEHRIKTIAESVVADIDRLTTIMSRYLQK